MPVSPVTPAADLSTPSHAPCFASAIGLSTLNSQLSTNARQRRAFTLLELLVVIGIIAILAGIVLGVGRRASESGKIARAKAEMAALSTALEAYKSQYGDYPQTGAGAANDPNAVTSAADDGPGILFNALAGKRGPKNALTPIDARALVELSKFSLQVPDRLPVSGNLAQLANAFVDPWGHRYVYLYDTTVNGWRNSSFVLYSIGPDGQFTAVPATGLIDVAAAGNADNLYANRH